MKILLGLLFIIIYTIVFVLMYFILIPIIGDFILTAMYSYYVSKNGLNTLLFYLYMDYYDAIKNHKDEIDKYNKFVLSTDIEFGNNKGFKSALCTMPDGSYSWGISYIIYDNENNPIKETVVILMADLPLDYFYNEIENMSEFDDKFYTNIITSNLNKDKYKGAKLLYKYLKASNYEVKFNTNLRISNKGRGSSL
jgi:hypothetical protein